MCKVPSYLQLFGKFPQLKSDHFNRIPLNRELCERFPRADFMTGSVGSCEFSALKNRKLLGSKGCIEWHFINNGLFCLQNVFEISLMRPHLCHCLVEILCICCCLILI